MPRTHQQTQVLRNDVFIREIGPHISARYEKNNKYNDPHDQVQVRNVFVNAEHIYGLPHKAAFERVCHENISFARAKFRRQISIDKPEFEEQNYCIEY